MASGLYLNEGPTSEETWPNHAIRSSVAITKLPLGSDILRKKNNKKEKCDFLKIFFLWIFKKTFWLSYSIYSILLVQENSKSVLWRCKSRYFM